MSQTSTVPAARTRAVLLVLLAALGGIFADIHFGPAESDALPVMGLWGFAGGVVVALMLGALIGMIAESRSRRRYSRSYEGR